MIRALYSTLRFRGTLSLVAAWCICTPQHSVAAPTSEIDAKAEVEFSVHQPLGQLRVAPVKLARSRGFVVVYAADKAIDPYSEFFFYPTDTLKLAVYDIEGRKLWDHDVGPGIPPGMWFCPVFPFDLDGDGVDEIWFVANPDATHPFAISKYKLNCLDGQTGELVGSWPWPRPIDRPLAQMFRNFILGGKVADQPVLVTAQGTYGGMKLQAWDPGMKLRWEHIIKPNDPGARGCHMCPVVDFNGDGIEEVLWGERLIEMDTGREIFCADRDSYRGHSDIVQPFYDQNSQEWRIFTCREKDLKAKPRVVTYDQRGRRIWGDLEAGHIDKGWVAHLHNPREFVAMGLRIQSKTAGPGGTVRSGTEAFCYDANTGTPLDSIPESSRSSLPVDLNGDGLHELVYELSDNATGVIDGYGQRLARLLGQVAFVGHLLDVPGEHVVTFDTDGTVRIYRDANAVDSPVALKRYCHPYYRANIRLSACGYNLTNLGGL